MHGELIVTHNRLKKAQQMLHVRHMRHICKMGKGNFLEGAPVASQHQRGKKGRKTPSNKADTKDTANLTSNPRNPTNRSHPKRPNIKKYIPTKPTAVSESSQRYGFLEGKFIIIVAIDRTKLGDPAVGIMSTNHFRGCPLKLIHSQLSGFFLVSLSLRNQVPRT